MCNVYIPVASVMEILCSSNTLSYEFSISEQQFMSCVFDERFVSEMGIRT
jgi:hypothetical protein